MEKTSAHLYFDRSAMDDIEATTTDAEIAKMAADGVRSAAENDTELEFADVTALFTRWRDREADKAKRDRDDA